MKYIFIVLMFVVSVGVNAANEAIPKDRKIEELVVYKNIVVVRFSPSFENSQECGSNEQDSLQFEYNDETGENSGLLSTLLAAASANKKVGFGVGGCSGQYPEIYRVDVQY